MTEIVHVAYSHLFPGLRLNLPAEADEYILAFADGSQAEAALLRSDTGSEALDVAGYITASGTPLDRRLWAVTEHTAHSLKLGIHLGQ